MLSHLLAFANLFKQLRSKSEKQTPTSKTRIVFEELDPRTLYSVDPFLGLIDYTELSEQQVIEIDVVELPSNILVNNNIELQEPIVNTETKIRQELVIIDSNIVNPNQLIDDLIANQDPSKTYSVLLLNNNENGIQAISDKLTSYSDLDALHIISHSATGSISLGNTQINSDNLSEYSELISKWQNSFDSEADVLIYGCNLAENSAGQHLINQIATLTGTDVSASIDKTGHSNFNANWELEFSTGIIDTKIAISQQSQQAWQGLLALHTYRDEFNNVSFTNNDGSLSWANDWQEIGETNGANTGKLKIDTEFGEQGLSISNKNNGVSREIDLSNTSNATLSFDYARIGLDDASDLFSLHVSDDGGSSWVLLDSWQGPANDSSLISVSYDISNFSANNTQIRFLAANGVNGNDTFFVDNIQISATLGCRNHGK